MLKKLKAINLNITKIKLVAHLVSVFIVSLKSLRKEMLLGISSFIIKVVMISMIRFSILIDLQLFFCKIEQVDNDKILIHFWGLVLFFECFLTSISLDFLAFNSSSLAFNFGVLGSISSSSSSNIFGSLKIDFWFFCSFLILSLSLGASFGCAKTYWLNCSYVMSELDTF